MIRLWIMISTIESGGKNRYPTAINPVDIRRIGQISLNSQFSAQYPSDTYRMDRGWITGFASSRSELCTWWLVLCSSIRFNSFRTMRFYLSILYKYKYMYVCIALYTSPHRFLSHKSFCFSPPPTLYTYSHILYIHI